ncbi:major facilitator superfamily domain-containing protein [Xylaria bambusicola]|uniref:major facilitator superfamily domain-containing protein n=1 Tax=Xylaria bambusicola TaxID=326684 RepID=UPI002007EC14|nr:major facilitator superfamily domain-containing protein [Xylaria bambusicola]KAI0525521.1 major facilitator superfamily domain-containing protein [Xylaria bambusicola]
METEQSTPALEGELSKKDAQVQDITKESDSSSHTSTAVEELAEKKQPEVTTSPPQSQEPKEGEALNDYLTGFNLFALLFSTGLTFFTLLLDNSIISTAVPKITSEFHSLPDVGWYAGAYQLTSAVLQPLTGKLYTFFPTKWTFLVFFFVFEIGSLLCALATSSPFFIVGRAVAGLGVSGLQNGSLSIVAGAVPLEKRAFYLGILIGTGQLGLVIGPLIGGLFTEYVSWRWCFWINLPIGAISGVLLALIRCPEQLHKEPFSLALVRRVLPQLDSIGFILFAPAATLLLLALQFGSGETYAWDSSVVIGLFVGSGVSAIFFLVWEWKAGDVAIIPFSMVKTRIVWTSTVQYVSLIAAIFVGTQFFPIYFQAVKGVGPVLSGVYLLPSILSQIVFVVFSGGLISKVGYYLPFAILAGVGATVAAGLISTWDANTSTGMWIGYQIVYGIRGCGIQLAVVAIQNALPAKQSQLGISFLVFAQTFSAAVLVVVGNTVFTQTLISETLRLVPSISPAEVLQAGGSAEAIRKLALPGTPELAALLQAFSNSFDTVCYLMVALAGISILASFGMGWVDVRKTKPEAKTEAPVEV